VTASSRIELARGTITKSDRLAVELVQGSDFAGWRCTSRRCARRPSQSDIGPAVLKTLIPRSHLQVWATAQAIRLLPQLPAPARRRLTSLGGGPTAMLNVVKLRDPSTL
jgi:hypothetical protein